MYYTYRRWKLILLLDLNVPIETIIQYTGVSNDEILELAQKK